MGWLLPVGVLLIVAGLGGSAGACYQSWGPDAGQTTSTAIGPDGGVPANQANPSSGGPLMLAALAGLVLAAGVGCIVVGMGRWTRPVPSATRPANPWSEQPRDTGEPPVGLV